MAPSKFQIYVDQSITQAPQHHPRQTTSRPVENEAAFPNAPDPARYKPERLPPHMQFIFDVSKLYPPGGGELSLEEINLATWTKLREQLADKIHKENLQRENEELRRRIEALEYQLAQKCSPPSKNRLSVVPQSLQPTQGLNEMSMYGAINDATSVVQDLWRNTNTFADKFTLPIDQSQYIRDNVPTSTPASKNDKRPRRLSRPSLGGSPTLKLSPITETSRDCNSKSSSSSSASGTPSQTKALKAIDFIDDDRPVDPRDPTTYQRLLKNMVETPTNYYKVNKNLPDVKPGQCVIQAGADEYLIDRELSSELSPELSSKLSRQAKLFTAQLLIDDSNDCSSDVPIKTVCLRVDQPANTWLYYICNELHRRLVKQKTRPDIELSVMIASPAIIYNDGSILVDEYFRFVTLQHFFDACLELNKPFPKSIAAYITLELVQLVRQMHTCDIIHMDIKPTNVLITCCPTRDDIANVDERTSIVKLIGFDRAMDIRLLSAGSLPSNLNPQTSLDSWSYEADWYGLLVCIHKMFFLEDMSPNKGGDGRWVVDKQFKGFPTNIWSSMFNELLNIENIDSAMSTIDQATEQLITWIKANVSFVLKEADNLDRILEEFSKSKSTRA